MFGKAACVALRRLTSILKTAALALSALLVVLLAIGAYLLSISQTLPDVGAEREAMRAARTSIVYAADGSELARWHGEQDRTYVPLSSMPDCLREAVVAIEDERFYEHSGVDAEAIARALRVNAEAGGYAQGGSTITQQVVKLLFTDGERSLERKIREALLAFELETRTGKDLVLETYLNLVYFGQGAYGVEAASQRYFGHGVGTVDLAEAALLAGIIQAPGRYDPCQDAAAAQERRDVVLRKMAELGYITAAERAEAAAIPLEVKPVCESDQVAAYFVEYVKQTLIDELGAEEVFGGGLRVYTTLDPGLQAIAETAAYQTLSLEGDPDAALVCLDHTNGDIVAMVGGRDFRADQFNLAVQGRRQPGSAFKTFVLVTALEQGVQPQDRFSAAPYEVQVTDGVWRVQNYENTVTGGDLTLAVATNWSVNAVYARLIMQVGPEAVVETAHRMGITSDLEAHPAIALGGLTKGVSPLEMASAYGTIAAAGVHSEPSAVVKVLDDTGTVVWLPERETTQALDAAIATQASKMLHDVVEYGTGGAARLPGWTAGKTGTTQEYRDAWFVGYSGRYTTAVWVGHAEGQIPMTDVHGIRVTGGSIPATIWRQFMEVAVPSGEVPGSADSDLLIAPPPVQQREVTICVESFQIATPLCPNTVTVTLDAASMPSGTCSLNH